MEEENQNLQPNPTNPDAQSQVPRTPLLSQQPPSPKVIQPTQELVNELAANPNANNTPLTNGAPPQQTNQTVNTQVAQPQSNLGSTNYTPEIASQPIVSGVVDGTPTSFNSTANYQDSDKQAMPKLIYLIVILMIVQIFLNWKQNTGVKGWQVLNTIGAIFSLVIAVGLLLRWQLARKLLVWLLVAYVVTDFVIIFGLVSLENYVNHQLVVHHVFQNLEQIVSTNQDGLGNKAQAAINTLNTDHAKSIHTVVVACTKIGLFALIGLAEIVYLTRQKVKDAFDHRPEFIIKFSLIGATALTIAVYAIGDILVIHKILSL
jgi:hypothetical protein